MIATVRLRRPKDWGVVKWTTGKYVNDAAPISELLTKVHVSISRTRNVPSLVHLTFEGQIACLVGIGGSIEHGQQVVECYDSDRAGVVHDNAGGFLLDARIVALTRIDAGGHIRNVASRAQP